MLNENLHYIKKILLSSIRKDGLFDIQLLGKHYNVLYEGSRHKDERDYRVMKFLGRDKKCILDIGANIGLSTLLLAEDNQAALYAFEASEYASKLIIHHASANGIGNRVTVINSLISDESGMAVPFYWDFNSGGASIYKGRMGHDFPIIKTTISIDDYVSLKGISPDLMKVDVEGAEYSVLKGCMKTLEKKKSLVFLELHAAGDLPLWQNAEQIMNLIKPIEYQMIYLRDKSKISNAEILKNRGRCHVLLCDSQFSFDSLLKDFDVSSL